MPVQIKVVLQKLIQAQSLGAVVDPLCNRNRMKGMILISLLLHHKIFFITFLQAYLSAYFNPSLYCFFLSRFT